MSVLGDVYFVSLVWTYHRKLSLIYLATGSTSMKNSVHSLVHTLEDTQYLRRWMSHYALMMAQRQIEHTLHCCQVFFAVQYGLTLSRMDAVAC
jgi:hypothetical protein